MTFEELISEIAKIKCREMRVRTKEVFEVVIAKSDLGPLTAALASYFGPPLKPEGVEPTREVGNLAEPYGGIRRDQTMYFRKTEKKPEIALLWPWGSGDALTVKIFRE